MATRVPVLSAQAATSAADAFGEAGFLALSLRLQAVSVPTGFLVTMLLDKELDRACKLLEERELLVIEINDYGNYGNVELKMEVRLPSKANGFSLPLHPLQFVVLVVILYFSLIWYGVTVTALPLPWQPAATALYTVVLSVLCLNYFLSTVINPADDRVLNKAVKGTSATLDRSRHKHAIEDSHCYLCEVPVGPKSKHCSACNKCVSNFDHHCLWLNNCVGGKNYKQFIVCLSFTVLGTASVFAVNLLEFVAYYTDRENGILLQPYVELAAKLAANSTMDPVSESAQFYGFTLPITDEGFLSTTMITALLALIACGLSGHLLVFHIYLACKRLSTYDFIMEQRDQEQQSQAGSTSSTKPANAACCSKQSGSVAPIAAGDT